MKTATLYLRHKRLDKGLTIEDMAKAIGTTCSTYSCKERGKNQFTVAELSTVATKLDIPSDELLKVFLLTKTTKSNSRKNQNTF